MRVMVERPKWRAQLTLVLLALGGCPLGPSDERPTVSPDPGVGTVIVRAVLTTGGPAAGLEAYVTSGRGDIRRETDVDGKATFTELPVGSWDVGYFTSPSITGGRIRPAEPLTSQKTAWWN